MLANNKRHVLIIEDEAAIAGVVAYALSKEAIQCGTALNAGEGLDMINRLKPDLVILDLMLPDYDGLDLCKEIVARHGIPVIVLTAKSTMLDKIIGLEIGADDYITKPFEVREVVARVKALLRRMDRIESTRETQKIRLGENLEIRPQERKLFHLDQEIKLTPKEFDLLLFLAQNKGIVFTREQLLNRVWGYDYYGDSRTVDIHIQRIRKKTNFNGCDSMIETVFGVGYKVEI